MSRNHEIPKSIDFGILFCIPGMQKKPTDRFVSAEVAQWPERVVRVVSAAVAWVDGGVGVIAVGTVADP